MLNIPETVKALYKRDGVNKNFRAHFPGGELPDITNENIVQESVKFQESVCSQDVFKFGLTEASVIEFETVGVANMYGMTIACYNEIDCSSLSAAEIAEIEAGTWDGEYVPLADSDLSYAYFRVPYGVYRVESCPRDHQAMTHRRVTAYTWASSQNSGLSYENAKMKLYTNVNEYVPDFDAVVCSVVAGTNLNVLSDFGYSTTEETAMGTLKNNAFSKFTFHTSHGDLMINLYSQYRYLGRIDFYDHPSDVCCVRPVREGRGLWSAGDTEVKSALVSSLSALLQEEDSSYSPTQDGFDSWADLVDSIISDGVNGTEPYLQLHPSNMIGVKRGASAAVIYETPYKITGGGRGIADTQNISVNKGEIIYPFISGKPIAIDSISSLKPSIRMVALAGFMVRYWYSGSTSYQDLSIIQFDSDVMVRGQKSGEANNLVAVASTADKILTPANGKKLKVFSFADSYNVLDYVGNMLELRASFAKVGEGILHLSNSSPIPVLPSEYSSVWWDEYDVNPVGVVRYSYTDVSGEPQVVDYQCGEGASIYDMTDNDLLSSASGLDQTAIEAMLDEYFVPHLSALNYVPVDMRMRGLPFVRAGDPLTVVAQDGTTLKSYVLRHEISGIQSLESQIDSESGLIVDSEEV